MLNILSKAICVKHISAASVTMHIYQQQSVFTLVTFSVCRVMLESFHSCVPEEGTTAQVPVLLEFFFSKGLFAKLLMADILTMKEVFKSQLSAVLLSCWLQ